LKQLIQFKKSNHYIKKWVAPHDEMKSIGKETVLKVYFIEQNYKAIKIWREIQQKIQNQINICAHHESVHCFFMEEHRKACKVLNRSELTPPLPYHMQRASQDYVNTTFLDDAGSVVQVDYLVVQVLTALEANKPFLIESSLKLKRLRSNSANVSSAVIQSSWRRFQSGKKLKSMKTQWQQRAIRLSKSLSLYHSRLAMLEEDKCAHMNRSAEVAVTRIQKRIKIFVSNLKRHSQVSKRNRYHNQLEKENLIKIKMRLEIQQKQELELWKCQKCEALGYKKRKNSFKSWDEVSQHIQDHNMLQVKRTQVHARKIELKTLNEKSAFLRKETNISNETAFLNELRHKREIALKYRYRLGLVDIRSGFNRECAHKSLINVDYVLLSRDGDTIIGRRQLDSKCFPKLVSSKHLVVHVLDTEKAKVQVIDTFSTNGTSLNGKKLEPGISYEMNWDDVLVLGCSNNPHRQSDVQMKLCKIDTFYFKM